MGPDDNQDITHVERDKEMRFISNKGRVVYTPEELPSHVANDARLLAKTRYHWSLLRKEWLGVKLPARSSRRGQPACRSAPRPRRTPGARGSTSSTRPPASA